MYRRRQSRIAGLAALVLLASFLSGSNVMAQLDIALAGISGVHQRAMVSGEIYVPPTTGVSTAALQLQGSQALGYRRWSCPPYSPGRPAGELRFTLSLVAWPDTIQWLSGRLTLPPESGLFSSEMSLVAAANPGGPVEWVEGIHTFRLYFGSDEISICYEDLVLPSVSLYSAHLVAQPAVAAEQSSFGAVKCLFR